jgi:hypothetical protein
MPVRVDNLECVVNLPVKVQAIGCEIPEIGCEDSRFGSSLKC